MEHSSKERSRDAESDTRPGAREGPEPDAGAATAENHGTPATEDHGAPATEDDDAPTTEDDGAASGENHDAAAAESLDAAAAQSLDPAMAEDLDPATPENEDIPPSEDGATTEEHRRRWLSWAWKIPAAGLAATVLLILPFRWIAPPTSAFIELYGGSEARSAYTWVDWEDISPNLALAVIASEDQRFPTHHGVDLEAIRAAIEEESGRGASTISQQVAKNLYLWAGRSWIRKGLEAYLTLWIEALWPKRRILEVYLNIAQFGPTTYGVGAASGQFFGVPPSQLTESHAALLAVVLPSPRRMSPARPSTYMEERAAWVREQMRMLGGTDYLRLLD